MIDSVCLLFEVRFLGFENVLYKSLWIPVYVWKPGALYLDLNTVTFLEGMVHIL